MKKCKKRVKGMTLMECIIALLVAGICGTIMAIVVTESMKFLRNANHTNTKVAAEAPAAAIQNVDVLYETTPGGTDPTAPAPTEISITVAAGGKTASVGFQKYDTGCLAGRSQNDASTNLNADLDFYVVETVQPTT